MSPTVKAVAIVGGIAAIVFVGFRMLAGSSNPLAAGIAPRPTTSQWVGDIVALTGAAKSAGVFDWFSSPKTDPYANAPGTVLDYGQFNQTATTEQKQATAALSSVPFFGSVF